MRPCASDFPLPMGIALAPRADHITDGPAVPAAAGINHGHRFPKDQLGCELLRLPARRLALFGAVDAVQLKAE